jgi:Flp pilus assembly protein TadD
MRSMVSREMSDALYAVAHHLLASNRTGEAAEAFRALVVHVPGDERGWLGLAACHQTRGELQLALGLLGLGSVATGHSPRIMLTRSALLRLLGDDDGADRLLGVARERSTGDDALEALVLQAETMRS